MTSTMVPTRAPQSVGHSRAVLHPIRAGSTATCAACDRAIKFSARDRRHQVIANVYVDGRWNRVEHHHPDCYDQAGQPHGRPKYRVAGPGSAPTP